MSVALKKDYQKTLDKQKKEVREFNAVCNRLEKKYQDEAISN